jgi:hypothetical protein
MGQFHDGEGALAREHPLQIGGTASTSTTVPGVVSILRYKGLYMKLKFNSFGKIHREIQFLCHGEMAAT